MEGTTVEAAGMSNGMCVASMVLGIIGLLSFCIVLPSLCALIFGIIGVNQVNKSGGQRGGKGMAISGIVMGILGMVMFIYMRTR